MPAASDTVLILHMISCHARQDLHTTSLTPVMLRIMLTEHLHLIRILPVCVALHLIRILLDYAALRCLCMLQVCKFLDQSTTCIYCSGDVFKEHQMKLDGAVVHVSLHPEPSKCIASFAVGPPVVADFATDTVKPLPAVVMGETHTHFSYLSEHATSSSDEGRRMQRLCPVYSATRSAPVIPN